MVPESWNRSLPRRLRRSSSLERPCKTAHYGLGPIVHRVEYTAIVKIHEGDEGASLNMEKLVTRDAPHRFDEGLNGSSCIVFAC